MIAGPIRFCRYAYAPNALGYCGPDDHTSLLEYGANQIVDGGLIQLARGFEGAWPYLSQIAHENHIADPLDDRVVEAYWVGSELLGGVGGAAVHGFFEQHFRKRMGSRWRVVRDAQVEPGSLHHNHHVFMVYPWVGMLRLEHAIEPLRVLDRCRIRWGEVVEAGAGRAVVRIQPLTFDGTSLSLGSEVLEEAVLAREGLGFLSDARPGDHVSLHWDWVCERLTPRQLSALKRVTASALSQANRLIPGSSGSLP